MKGYMEIVSSEYSLQKQEGALWNYIRTEYYKDIWSFWTRVIDQWYSLPEDVISANSINIFKNMLDTFLANNVAE